MTKAAATASVSTKKDAERFRKAAKAYTKRATKSKKAAQKTLVALGIHTKTGGIAKRYK